MTYMRKIAQALGVIAFWLTWPVTYWYFRNSERTRILLRCGDSILMTKGWLSAGKWALPGGGLHKGEPPVDGAVRELAEEVGLRVPQADLRFVGVDAVSTHGMKFSVHCYVTDVDSPHTLHIQRHEIAEARWLLLADLTAHNTDPDAWQCLQKYAGRTQKS